MYYTMLVCQNGFSCSSRATCLKWGKNSTRLLLKTGENMFHALVLFLKYHYLCHSVLPSVILTRYSCTESHHMYMHDLFLIWVYLQRPKSHWQVTRVRASTYIFVEFILQRLMGLKHKWILLKKPVSVCTDGGEWRWIGREGDSDLLFFLPKRLQLQGMSLTESTHHWGCQFLVVSVWRLACDLSCLIKGNLRTCWRLLLCGVYEGDALSFLWWPALEMM